jgi:hypothetical protein
LGIHKFFTPSIEYDFRAVKIRIKFDCFYLVADEVYFSTFEQEIYKLDKNKSQSKFAMAFEVRIETISDQLLIFYSQILMATNF